MGLPHSHVLAHASHLGWADSISNPVYAFQKSTMGNITKGAIIFYREGAVCLWGGHFFCACQGGTRKKLATRDHKQTAPLPVKNDSSLMCRVPKGWFRPDNEVYHITFEGMAPIKPLSCFSCFICMVRWPITPCDKISKRLDGRHLGKGVYVCIPHSHIQAKWGQNCPLVAIQGHRFKWTTHILTC